VLVEDRDTDAKLRNEATWLLAWGHFDAGELEAAQGWFQKIVDDKAVHADDAKGVVTALRARADLEQKDPLLAGLLSLVPGLGHVYLGQWGTGLTSAGYNALFLVGAISAFVTGQWGVGLVLAAFELGWYGGGVFGAVAGAYRTNRDVVRNWRDDVLADHGATRELPEMRTVEPFLPGSLSRFTNLGDTPATPTVAPAPAGP
jgi:TM2 domain-containing membrane protein YozV